MQNGCIQMTSVLRKDQNPKTKEQSLKKLQEQYAIAVEANDTNQIKKLEIIFRCLGEPPRASSLSKALKPHTKKKSQ